MENQSIKNAFERMWAHTTSELEGKANKKDIDEIIENIDEKIAAIPTPDVSEQINTHNVSVDAHNDIRDLISGLSTRLNTLADSDDTTLDQLSEIVAYIKSNKELIEAITTSKVSVEDIIDNLTTNVSNKVLSAAQGVTIKALIDELEEELNNHTHEIDDVNGLRNLFSNYATVEQLNNKADFEHSHDDKYYTESEIDSKIFTLNTAINDKASSIHTHEISEVINLQSSLDEKVPMARKVNGKALFSDITLDASDVSAYSKTEIDDMTFITKADIATICDSTISVANLSNEVRF